MAILHVQSRIVGFGTDPGARSLAYSSSVAAGRLLCCAVASYNTGGDITVTVADDVNGSWTQAGTYTTQANERISIWYKAPSGVGSGTTTVTVTPSANAYLSFAIHEYSGVKSSAPLRSTSNNFTNSTTPSTGSVTATVGDLIFAAFGFSSVLLTSAVADAPMTDRVQVLDGGPTEGLCSADNVSASGNTNASWVISTTAGWQAIGASFKPADSPVGPPGGGGGKGKGKQPPALVFENKFGDPVPRNSDLRGSDRRLLIPSLHGAAEIGTGATTFTISASGDGAADAVGSGASTATFSAAATGTVDAPGSGAAEFSISASAAGLAEAIGSGASEASFSGSGVPLADAVASGASTVTITAAGVGAMEAVSSGSAAFTLAASGVGGLEAVASGSASFSISLLGSYSSIGSGAAEIRFAVAGQGVAALSYVLKYRPRRP